MQGSEPRYPGGDGSFRISQSSLETYLKCGLWYKLDRENRHRRCTVRMAVGTGVAAGARADNEAKLASGRGLELAALVERSIAGYETEVGASEVQASPVELAEGKDRTAAAARVYGLEVSPKIVDLLAAEDQVVAKLGEDIELCGRPDYCTRLGVGDLKTGQPWTQERADRSRQLTLYGALYCARTGAYPQRVWIDSVYHTPRGWHASRLLSMRTAGDYAALWAILRAVRDAIQQGVFLPAPEGAWWCSRAYCPHWCSCVVGGGRRQHE